jgi:hypothetical protein
MNPIRKIPSFPLAAGFALRTAWSSRKSASVASSQLPKTSLILRFAVIRAVLASFLLNRKVMAQSYAKKGK